MAYRAPYKIDDRKLRFALVGCGRISDRHTDAIAAHKDRAELVAVCDSDPAALDMASTALKVPGYVSLEPLLADSNADIVTLCTPSGLHPEHGIVAAEAGKHVLSEKPMGISLEAADRLITACATARITPQNAARSLAGTPASRSGSSTV